MRERSFLLTSNKTQFIHSKFGEQTRLANALGIKLAVFSHYMHGRRHIPESLLLRLCDLTDKRPSDFLEHPAEKIIADASFIT
jgi:DNA-binding Xre family transcriptional regulator